MVKYDSYEKSNAVAFSTVLVVFIVAFGAGFLVNDLLKTGNANAEPANNKTNVVNSLVPQKAATVNVVAVTEEGIGVIGKANIELVSGRGRTLINTNPFIEPDTQQSAETAVSYAINYTKSDIRNYDLIVSFTMTDLEGNAINSRGQIIGGPSAGAALTVATIAVLQGKEIRKDVAVTGTVEADGSVGKVGGIIEKADAAGKAGIKTFLVPLGQAQVTYYEKIVETDQSGKFQIKRVRYVPKLTSLGNYTLEQWNMSAYEIKMVEDAIQYSVA